MRMIMQMIGMFHFLSQVFLPPLHPIVFATEECQVLDIDHPIIRFWKMTFNREQITENYIDQLIDSMDYKTMMSFVYDTLKDNLSTYSDEELITEVEDYYPELLEVWCFFRPEIRR